MEELTRWFYLSKGEVPPCPGVYKVEDPLPYSYWNGSSFNFCMSTPDFALRSFRVGDRGGLGEDVSLWRGLAQDPARKLSRRTDPATSKEAATKAVRSGMVMTHCQRILACLKDHGPQNANQVGARLKLHPHQVMKRFSDLKNDGFASPNGKVLDGQRVWNAL